MGSRLPWVLIVAAVLNGPVPGDRGAWCRAGEDGDAPAVSKELTAENARLKQEAAGARADAEKLMADLRAQGEETRKARDRAAQAEQRVADLADRAQQAESSLAAAKTRIAKLDAELAAQRDAYDKLLAELAARAEQARKQEAARNPEQPR